MKMHPGRDMTKTVKTTLDEELMMGIYKWTERFDGGFKESWFDIQIATKKNLFNFEELEY